MLAAEHVGHRCQCQGMLAEHRSLEDIQKQPGEPTQPDAPRTRRENRPVQYGEDQERRPCDIQPVRQRYYRQQKGDESREQHPSSWLPGTHWFLGVASGAGSGVAGGAGFLGVAARGLSPGTESFELGGTAGVDPRGLVTVAGAPDFDGGAAAGFTVPDEGSEIRAPVPAGGDAGGGVSGFCTFGRGGGAACGWSLELPVRKSPAGVG